MVRTIGTAVGIVIILMGIALFGVSDVYIRTDKWSDQYRPVQLPPSWHVKDHLPYFTVAAGVIILVLSQAAGAHKAAAH